MVCSTQRTTEQLNHGLCSIGYPLPVTRQTAIKVQTSLEVLNPANRRDNWQYANCHDNWQCATEPFVWARVELYYTSPRLAKGWWGIYKHWTKQRSGVVESTYNFTPVYTTNRSLWLRNIFLGPFFGATKSWKWKVRTRGAWSSPPPKSWFLIRQTPQNMDFSQQISYSRYFAQNVTGFSQQHFSFSF